MFCIALPALEAVASRRRLRDQGLIDIVERVIAGRLDYRTEKGWHDPRGEGPRRTETRRRVAIAESLQRGDNASAFYDWHRPQ